MNCSLFSDEWIRELDYQRPPIPTSTADTHISSLKPLDFREIPPARRIETRYHDLPPDHQDYLLTNINQELIEHEIHDIVTEITGQTITSKVKHRSLSPSPHLTSSLVKQRFQYE